MKNIIIGLLFTLMLTPGFSQGRFDAKMDVKNMHYWRGLRVSDAFVTAPMVGYFSDGLSVFAWGGMSLDGNYKEVSQIVSYTSGKFNITLLDIFNFTDAPNASYFNLNSEETNHITDLSVSYDFTEHMPLKVMMATVVYGNDRDASASNRYSTYLELALPFDKGSFMVQPFAAAGFALSSDATHSLYGNEAFDLVNVGLRVGKTVYLGPYGMPVAATLGFNPSLKQASVEIALSLF